MHVYCTAGHRVFHNRYRTPYIDIFFFQVSQHVVMLYTRTTQNRSQTVTAPSYSQVHHLTHTHRSSQDDLHSTSPACCIYASQWAVISVHLPLMPPGRPFQFCLVISHYFTFHTVLKTQIPCGRPLPPPPHTYKLTQHFALIIGGIHVLVPSSIYARSRSVGGCLLLWVLGHG